jgi:hypothetical protein
MKPAATSLVREDYLELLLHGERVARLTVEQANLRLQLAEVERQRAQAVVEKNACETRISVEYGIDEGAPIDMRTGSITRKAPPAPSPTE